MRAQLTLAEIVARNAAFFPDKVAIRCEGEALTYAGFSARIERLAAALSEHYGVGPGDRAAYLGLNSPIFWCSFMLVRASAPCWCR